ncbi:DUF6059 family protein [Streptomyces venezuelae]
MASFIRRLWREVYASLRAYGAFYISAAHPAAAPPPPPAARPGGPPAGHPERLCPEVALTPVERALNRQLENGP